MASGKNAGGARTTAPYLSSTLRTTRLTRCIVLGLVMPKVGKHTFRVSNQCRLREDILADAGPYDIVDRTVVEACRSCGRHDRRCAAKYGTAQTVLPQGRREWTINEIEGRSSQMIA